MDLLRRIFAPSKVNTETTKSEGSDFSPHDNITANPLNHAKSKPDEVNGTATAEIPHLALQGETRPLAPEIVLSSTNNHLTFGLATDVGMIRTNNQDALFSFVSSLRGAERKPDFGLFVVADGMGGHHDGEKASRLTVNTIVSQVIRQVYLQTVHDDPNNIEQVPITETLIESVQTANNCLIEKVPDGGTTATTVVIIGDLAYVVHVGDTRVYLIANDEIEQITRDHSLVQRLIELGQLTAEEALTHPQRNVLYRALGQNPNLEVDAITRRLNPNSRMLICSDGLWNMLPEKTIREIVVQGDSPQSTCEKLIGMANMMGGSDNITAIVIHVPRV
jgi:protein phosphatase